jgi:hypothetical protein
MYLVFLVQILNSLQVAFVPVEDLNELFWDDHSHPWSLVDGGKSVNKAESSNNSPLIDVTYLNLHSFSETNPRSWEAEFRDDLLGHEIECFVRLHFPHEHSMQVGGQETLHILAGQQKGCVDVLKAVLVLKQPHFMHQSRNRINSGIFMCRYLLKLHVKRLFANWSII